MRLILIVVMAVLLELAAAQGYEKLKEIYSWKSMEFKFPNDFIKRMAIAKKDFIPGNPLPIDVDVYTAGSPKPIVFVSMPRLPEGVPVTLGYVTDEVSPEGNPLIAPYPSYEFNTVGSCNHIVSVFRMQIDECNRLWVLDSGKLQERQVCRPQLHVFSLTDNRLLGQYKFSPELFRDASIYVTIAVDVRDMENSCENTFAYIADVTGFQLIVYDHSQRKAWRIHNNLFYPYPPEGTFEINNERFDLMDGIIGLALSPVQPDGDRILYFHSLASRVESWVLTSIIRNQTLFESHSDAAARSFQSFPLTRTSQSAAQAMDRNGVLFFGLSADTAIGCWNSKHFPTYGGNNNEVLIADSQTLQFSSGIKVITGKNGRQELWVVSSPFQKFMTGTLDPSQKNFRVQAGFIDELVRGTKCDTSSHNGQSIQLQSIASAKLTFNVPSSLPKLFSL